MSGNDIFDLGAGFSGGSKADAFRWYTDPKNQGDYKVNSHGFDPKPPKKSRMPSKKAVGKGAAALIAAAALTAGGAAMYKKRQKNKNG